MATHLRNTQDATLELGDRSHSASSGSSKQFTVKTSLRILAKQLVEWYCQRKIHNSKECTAYIDRFLQYANKMRLKALLKDLKIDLILDVGANAGQFGTEMRQIGYRGEIHSFEPNSLVFERLRERCETDRNWLCHKVALGRSSGHVELNITDSPVFASVLTPRHSAAAPDFPGNYVVGQDVLPRYASAKVSA